MPDTSLRHLIHPVLLSGGAGTRLWPMSREHYPKQLLSLCSKRSMLQDTASRVDDPSRFAPPLVICNQEHRFVIAEQMRQMAAAPAAIMLEPVGRNTAAAAAVAALHVVARDPYALLLVLPADHLIRDIEGFIEVVDRAAAAASAGHLVTFGIHADTPETGYGYIRRGPAVPGLEGVYQVAEFVEKPQLETAQRYVADGEHLWNSGMFLFPAAGYLAELDRLEPAMLAACRTAIEKGTVDRDFFRLDPEAFSSARSASIDYAVMEHTHSAVMVPAEIGWTDVGAWSALWQIGDKDATGNVCLGDVVTQNTRNCYIRSQDLLTAVVGIEDAVIVVTEDAILVSAKDEAQNIKPLVEQLKAAGRMEVSNYRKVFRPWGFYQSLHVGERFQVKRLTVNPGRRLSLQKHYHRAEHWVVVNGTALVTRGNEQVLLCENESTYIPLGLEHRLENPGKVPLNLIEVQSGAYLGEDDIIRYDEG